MSVCWKTVSGFLLERMYFEAAGENCRENGGGMKQMSKKQTEARKQRELIRAFDKELFSYTGQVAWFLPGIFSVILLCLTAIPVQKINREDTVMLFVMINMIIWLSYTILLPYVDVSDGTDTQKKRRRTYDLLKYLPVSKAQYRRVRMEYLFRYLWKLTLIGLVLQCGFAFLSVKRIDIINIVYAIIMLFVIPMVSGWFQEVVHVAN